MAGPGDATRQPARLRGYVASIAVFGCAVFAYCIVRVADRGVPLEWWMFAALTFISGRITLPVPSVEASFTLSEVFLSSHQRVMPAENPAVHPATRAVGGARASVAAAPAALEVVAATAASVPEVGAVMHDVLAVSSLARALSGDASLGDAGALAWMTLHYVVPACSMALFVDDQQYDLLTVAYAAGAHAPVRQLRKMRGSGIPDGRR